MISPLKHKHVYHWLLENLSGKELGARLPSEREVAAELGVNIATVRRAFRQLVVGGIVEKRIGSGTYLKQKIENNWQSRPVNLVVGTRCNFAIQNELSHCFEVVLRKSGRQGLFRLAEAAGADEILASAIDYRQPTIVSSDLVNVEIMREAPDLFVTLSSMSYEQGIPTVRGDDAYGIKLLLTLLRRCGHRHIAFFCTGSVGKELEDYQAAIWAAEMGENYEPELKITLNGIRHHETIQCAKLAMDKAVKALRFTALICSHDELMFGAMAALRMAGKRIPQDVSVVSIGNSSLSEFMWPPITSIDPDLCGHLETAIELLDYNCTHKDSINLLRLVRPFLVKRESICNIRNCEREAPESPPFFPRAEEDNGTREADAACCSEI